MTTYDANALETKSQVNRLDVAPASDLPAGIELADNGQIVARSGDSTWIVQDGGEVGPYGRPHPPGRRFWAHHVSGAKPFHMRGVVGFYEPTLEAIASHLALPADPAA